MRNPIKTVRPYMDVFREADIIEDESGKPRLSQPEKCPQKLKWFQLPSSRRIDQNVSWHPKKSPAEVLDRASALSPHFLVRSVLGYIGCDAISTIVGYNETA